MKVILNVDAITQPLTGIGNYAYQLASGLPKHPDINACKLYSSHRWIKDADHALNANQTLVNVRNNIPFKAAALSLYTWQKNRWFKSKGAHYTDNHILHSPNFLLMPFAGRNVVTIHDLSFYRYPETHPKERVKLLEKHLPKSLAQADAIIAVSEYIKKEIEQTLTIPAEKIHVVAQGVGPEYQPFTANQNLPSLRKHGLDKINYLLSVATLEPRKNLNALIDAYLLLPKKTRQEYKLVIVGAKGWLSETLQQRIKQLVNQKELLSLGYVKTKDLPHLYAGASGFVLPSLYEGFGLPILEAMAAGVPVLTSNQSSLPEVANGAAILSNAHDVEDISSGLIKLIEDKKWRETAVKKGLENAKKHTWQRCVNKTVDVYKKL